MAKKFKKNNGVFITFEGVDGCGKSTQLNQAEEYLTKIGRTVHRFREPGSTPAGERIREVLLDKKLKISNRAELFLYEAARAQMVEREIEPLLKTDCVVLCDRFYDSTTAYQGYGRRLDTKMITTLNHIAAGTCIPDLTFVFMLPLSGARPRDREQLDLHISEVTQVRGAMNKVGPDPDRIELQTEAFFSRVAIGFQKIGLAEQDRVKLIDASPSIDEVFISVKKELDSFFVSNRLL